MTILLSYSSLDTSVAPSSEIQWGGVLSCSSGCSPSNAWVVVGSISLLDGSFIATVTV